MKPVLSVLLPIYNVEKYLSKCMDSILKQTLENIQIICVNDGSNDNCLSILQKYCNQDSRITLLNRTNAGYGAALNYGFQFVKSDYISIIEPDDFLSIDAFEKLYDLAKKYPTAEIIKFAYWNYLTDDNEERITPSDSSRLTLTKKPFSIDRYPQLLLYHPSIWSCLYRTSFLKNNNIHFVEAPGAGWTDNPFFIETMCLAKNIIWKNSKVYYYRQGHSTSSSNLKDCRIPILRVLDIMNFVEKANIQDFGILICIYKRIFSYINIVRDNKYYVAEEIEPLVKKILTRLDVNIVESVFFTEQEQQIYFSSLR